MKLYRKNNFAKESKNLAKYRFENNFVKIIMCMRCLNDDYLCNAR